LFLLSQATVQTCFFDMTQIVSSRDPLCDFSPQEDWTFEQIAALGTRLESMFLHAAIPDAAPGVLFSQFAANTSTGCF
jgi:hypothetical protein